MSKPTEIARIRRSGGEIVVGCDIYIGRELRQGGWNLPRSIWANPYSIKNVGSAGEACKLYETYIRNKLMKEPSLIDELRKLSGKTLGCWCKNSRDVGSEKISCHGDVLIKLLKEYGV